MTTTLQILSFISFALGVVCFSISQLQQHGKIKWKRNGEPFSFWGPDSHVRKYKEFSREKGEAFFLSTTLLVALTDGYHLMQAGFLLFLSLGVSLATELENWKQYLLVYIGIHLVHFVTYRLLQR